MRYLRAKLAASFLGPSLGLWTACHDMPHPPVVAASGITQEPQPVSGMARPLPPDPAPAGAQAPTTEPEPPTAQPPLLRAEPVLTDHLLKLRAAAQGRVLGKGFEIQDEFGHLRGEKPVEDFPYYVNGNALGQFVPIENEGALRAFHGALSTLDRVHEAAGETGKTEGGGLVRILAYGASHTQGDFFTGYLRYYLQARFGNGGQGFVQMTKTNQWYRTLDTKVESKGFRIQHAQRKSAPEHGRFGLLGAAGVARYTSSYGRVSSNRARDPETQNTRFELYYDTEPGGGDLRVKVDGHLETTLSTHSTDVEARYHAFERELGWHKVEVRPRGNGPVRLFGITMERPGPGIVIDTLGINGTRAANVLAWDAALLTEHIRRRAPSLILLAYGTNETMDVLEPDGVYERHLTQVLQRLQTAAPQASCVLVGPGDFPRQTKTPRDRLTYIIDVQRRVAFARGCGFWDTHAFMGGNGSMHRWVTAEPAMAAQDHIHLTPRGYVKLGMTLGDALLRAFDAQKLQNPTEVTSLAR